MNFAGFPFYEVAPSSMSTDVSEMTSPALLQELLTETDVPTIIYEPTTPTTEPPSFSDSALTSARSPASHRAELNQVRRNLDPAFNNVRLLGEMAAMQSSHEAALERFEARLTMIEQLHNRRYNNLKRYSKDKIGDMLVCLHRAKRMKTCDGVKDTLQDAYEIGLESIDHLIDIKKED